MPIQQACILKLHCIYFAVWLAHDMAMAKYRESSCTCCTFCGRGVHIEFTPRFKLCNSGRELRSVLSSSCVLGSDWIARTRRDLLHVPWLVSTLRGGASVHLRPAVAVRLCPAGRRDAGIAAEMSSSVLLQSGGEAKDPAVEQVIQVPTTQIQIQLKLR